MACSWAPASSRAVIPPSGRPPSSGPPPTSTTRPCWPRCRPAWASPWSGSRCRSWARTVCCRRVAGKVGVLALQGAFREHCRALVDVGLEPVEVRQAGELAGLEGLVIPGGESTTMSKLMVAYGLETPIRELHASGVPVFGTCAGMILAASKAVDGLPDQRYLGLIDVLVRRNAFGRQVASFEATLTL